MFSGLAAGATRFTAVRSGEKKVACSNEGSAIQQAESLLDKRHSPRFRLAGISADVSNGIDLCKGLACNISRSGIGFIDLPEKFSENSNNLSVVISGREKIFRMVIQPKWHYAKGAKRRLGGEVVYSPAGWPEFIQQYESIFAKFEKNVTTTGFTSLSPS